MNNGTPNALRVSAARQLMPRFLGITEHQWGPLNEPAWLLSSHPILKNPQAPATSHQAEEESYRLTMNSALRACKACS